MKTLLIAAAIALVLLAGGCRTSGEVEVGQNATPCAAPAES